MKHTPDIYDPAKGLSKILEVAKQFNPSTFRYALEYRNWNMPQLEAMSNQVSDNVIRLEREEMQLKAFAQEFNHQFATNNNRCFNHALDFLRSISSTLREAKRLLRHYAPQLSTQQQAGQPPYTQLSAAGYPPCVLSLYEGMTRFFAALLRSLLLCRQMLGAEKRIQQDHGYCHELFRQFRQQVHDETYDLLQLIPRDAEQLSERSNLAIASRNRYANDEAWASAGFHQFSRTEVRHLVIKQLLDQEADNDLTHMEKQLFGNDQEKVHRYRYIIAHFDELVPAGYNRKNLPAKLIQMFFRYVGIAYGLEEMATTYFNEQYTASPSHLYLTVSYQAINGYKREVLADRDGQFTQFKEKLRTRYFAPQPLQMLTDS